jgi:hypothetical protein
MMLGLEPAMVGAAKGAERSAFDHDKVSTWNCKL